MVKMSGEVADHFVSVLRSSFEALLTWYVRRRFLFRDQRLAV